jgi:hypothetical protein
MVVLLLSVAIVVVLVLQAVGLLALDGTGQASSPIRELEGNLYFWFGSSDTKPNDKRRLKGADQTQSSCFVKISRLLW